MKAKNTTSGPRPMGTSKPKTHVMVTLSAPLRRQVETLAEQEDRSMASICRRFVEQGLRKHTKLPTRQH